MLLSFTLGASAANLVANGDFETGTYTPEWTLTPGGPFDLVCQAGVPIGAATCIVNSGQYAMTFGLFGAQDSLSQTLATVPGQTYRLSFFLANDNPPNQNTTTFAVVWDGSTVFSLPSPQPTFAYGQQIFDVVATTSSTQLTFVAQHDPSQWFLDDVSVVPAPTVTKAIAPSPVYVNAPAQITITLNNSNPTPVTGVAFTDSYPPNLTNTSSPGEATTCGGSVTAAASGNSVALSGGTIPANGSCTVTVSVQSAIANTYVNSTGTITASNAPSFGPAMGTLVVLAPPTASKVFAPNPILVNAASVLTITLNNPSAQALTGVSFADTYPANLVNTATPAGATSCGGSVSAAAGGNSVALAGATIPASSSCTVTVNVTSALGGVYVNDTGNISTGVGGIPGVQGTLTVVGPPTIAKTFNPDTIPIGGATSMTITLTNPNATVAVTGVAFLDTYPTGLTNTASPGATNTCGGALTTAANGASLQLASGTIPAGGSCSISVNVTSTAQGAYLNSTGTVTTANAGNAGPASATLNVNSAIGVAKSFAPNQVSSVGTSLLQITLTNPNAAAVTGIAFTDSYPANVTNTVPPGLVNTCGGTASAAANGTSLALTGGTIPANGSCALTVFVTSSVVGSYLNSTGTVTTTNSGSAGPATATLQVTAAAVPGIVYVPLEPCRIMDTRHATLGSGVQGPLVGNVLYNIPGFINAGQNWSEYGGTGASDCGLTNPPGGSIRAVALVATILNPNYDSFLGISDSSDLSTVLSQVALNYTRGQGLSTMYMVPQVTSNTIYFAMPPALSAHMIFDVVGYHVVSDATALQCTTQSSSPVVIGSGASNSATSPACGTAYALTGGSCTSTAASLSLTQDTATGGNTTWLCAATNNGAASASLTATANCCRVPGQ
ncbi:MAG: hypothetical protein ABI537_11680 [Casimicrobiaceae bacterium]